MSRKEQQQKDTGFEGIEQVLTRSERFIEDNQKRLTQVVLGIVIIVLLIISAKRFYFTPLSEDAARDIFMAEKFFERDSFNLALNGYGTYPGFLQIIEDYGLTKTANLAKYYAGVCFLHLEDYENAIHYLNKFKTKDPLVGSASSGALGDAYSGLEWYDQAVRTYLKGADKFANNFSSPVLLQKAGIVYEEMGDYRSALETYKKIELNYQDTPEGREINKFISRAEIMLDSNN